MLALLCSPSNEALHSSTATRLICLAGLRVHRLFKVTLKRPSAIVRGRTDVYGGVDLATASGR